ncbi:MAG: hypothetical protein K6T61_00855 [Bryobacteraceae bacterium]|nr:hypothetical protein [Bryobacteraceae bacterium]
MRSLIVKLLFVSVFPAGVWCQDSALTRLAGYDFAAVGIVPGQTVRITLLNTTRHPLPDRALPPCRVDVRLYDQGGSLLQQETIENLAPGTAKWLDYSPQATILIFPPPRILVAASLTVRTERPSLTSLVNLAPQSCTVVPTLEIFDINSSKTTIALAGPPLVPVLPAPRRPMPLEAMTE